MTDHVETHEVDVGKLASSPEIPVNPTHSINLPINKDIAEGLQINNTAHVSFDGIITEIDAGYSDDDDDYSVRLDVQRVKISSENVFEKMAREDDEDE